MDGRRSSLQRGDRRKPGRRRRFPASGDAPDSGAFRPRNPGDSRAGGTRPPGTLFGTFLVVERGDEAWIIDQHAAHERLLYDRFAAARTSQKLLIPDEFEVTENQDGMLRAHHHRYREIGIELERVAVRRWQLVAMPGEYRNNSEDMIETILELGGLHEELDRQFVAEMACKAALKAGDYLDGVTVLSLAERTLALEEPRCPHGRPLYIELTRERLERLIGRR
jgi:DNA mismatch repair protein MutL